MFPLEVMPKDLVKVAQTQLLGYFKMIQLVDTTAVLIKWNSKTDLDLVVCLKPSALPSTLTGLQAYANQLHLQPEGGNTWCNLCIQFFMDPGEFMQELSEQT